ncbi:hypothetical protein NGB36_21465 [Streptomyces sp. RB6PN25]|uniref:Uncharacterized protein n=1 Tax=Streptomyces humicola TaxID=2953240 RepID=A0ABT1Q2Z0_9ACTN|nr:hypothetical protein [Streptomyces humicola]MCQ4083105.1 hypothetical protein [Streptomyces humicola]
MHVTRALAAAALAGTALGVAAPLALADDSGGSGNTGNTGNNTSNASEPSSASNIGPSNIIVMPATVKQGATFTVTVDGASCRGTGRTYDAVVESAAFPRTPLKGMATQGSSYATPQIFAATRPGAYDITATCGGKTVTGGGFTVVAAGASASSASSAAPARPSMPTKGAKAGLGAATRSMDSTETALGATALAAAVAATGVYLIRRRASGSR